MNKGIELIFAKLSPSFSLSWAEMVFKLNLNHPPIPPGKVSKWPNIARLSKANIINLMSRPDINKVMTLMSTFNETDEVSSNQRIFILNTYFYLKPKQNDLLPSSALNYSFSWAEMVINLDFHPTHPSGKVSKWPKLAICRKAKLVILVSRPHITK